MFAKNVLTFYKRDTLIEYFESTKLMLENQTTSNKIDPTAEELKALANIKDIHKKIMSEIGKVFIE